MLGYCFTGLSHGVEQGLSIALIIGRTVAVAMTDTTTTDKTTTTMTVNSYMATVLVSHSEIDK